MRNHRSTVTDSVFYLALASLLLLGSTACRKKGCTDEAASNYSPKATFEDGSCNYNYGCTDPKAVNYDSLAGIDDGSCRYEFIADDSTFAGFEMWSLAATATGNDTTIDGAHGSADSSVIRYVYYYEDAVAINGRYPQGTRIVKHATDSSGAVQMYTAMAKRGNNYDPDHNDWEWFILNADGTIALDTNGNELRGENLIDFGCASCHAKAKTDFVFTK